MIKKELEIPILVHKLQAFERRLPKNHREYHNVKKDLANCLSGYYGEREIDYHLRVLPKQEYHIYHDLRLPTEEHKHFQMDVPVASPNFLLNLEVKNFTGEIFCDTTFNQLIRRYEGKEKRYQDPLAQVLFQRYHWSKWLERHRYSVIPIEHLVVFTNPNCILKTDNKDHPFVQRFLHVEHLGSRIESLKQKYQRLILNPHDLSNLHRLWLKQHTPADIDVLKKYKVSPDELLCGPICSKCDHLPMERGYGKWVCPICHYILKDAHIPALRDHALLIKPTITNQECRELLQIDDPNTVRNIMRKLNMPLSGTNKGVVYSLIQLLNF